MRHVFEFISSINQPTKQPINRPFFALSSQQCAGFENFVGEGEVDDAAILSWSHEAITFRVPPGLGHKEVQLTIRGAMQRESGTDIPYFRYNDPEVTSVRPLLFDTDGGDVVEIIGSNFGPAQWNRSAVDLPTDTFELFSPPIPLDLAPSLPQGQIAIALHRGCVAYPANIFGRTMGLAVRTASGSRSLDLCEATILHHEHGRLVIKSIAGIGRDRELRVHVVDGPYDQASNSTLFAYYPPLITDFWPQVVYMDPTKTTPVTTAVYGRYFGNADKAVEQGWTPEEMQVHMAIGGAPCASSKRFKEDTQWVIECTIDEGLTTAGYRNVSLTLAGQTGFKDVWPRSQSLLIVCSRGSYGHVNETCLPCPAQDPNPLLIGADCYGYDPTVQDFDLRHTYPVPRAGWFNLNSSDAISSVTSPGQSMMDACPGGRRHFNRDVCIVPCDPPEACLGDNWCAVGYTSKAPMYRCSSCDKGFYKRAGQCIKCPDSPAALFVGFIALVMVVAVGGFLLNKRQVNIAIASIGIDYFQVLAIFAQSRIQWPAPVRELMHVLSAFNLNIEIVAPECLIPDVSYKQKFAFIMLLPLCVGGLLCTVFLYQAAYKKIVLKRTRRTMFSHRPVLISSLLVLTYLMYLYISRTLLDVFNCTPTTPPDGKLYLQVVFEECGVPGGTQVVLLPFAIAGFIVYTFGYPAYMAQMLWRHRELVMEDQLLRAKGVGNDKLTNPHAYELRRKYSRSYFAFKPDFAPIWVVLIILRKFFIALTAVVFNKSPSFQMAACLLVMFCAYGLQVRFSPYMSPSEYDLVLKDHTEKAFTSALHARLRNSILSVESRGRKRTRRNLMTPEGKVDRHALLGILGSWLFNYNTIESVMLFAAGE